MKRTSPLHQDGIMTHARCHKNVICCNGRFTQQSGVIKGCNGATSAAVQPLHVHKADCLTGETTNKALMKEDKKCL